MGYSKLTLAGTELDIRASDAQAVAHYIAELDKNTDGTDGTSTPLPGANNLGAAIAQLPAIGSSQDFDAVQGAPSSIDPTTGATAVPGGVEGVVYVTHTLRVSRHRIYTGDTGNGNKLHCDAFYTSKPRPVIEFGSSAVQQKTATYLPDTAQVLPANPSDPTIRQQMVLDFTEKAGSLISARTDASGNATAAWPPTDIPWLKTPCEGSMFRFGTSLRISSWWYNDEATVADFSELSQLFVAATNKGQFLFADDDQRWLCTSMPTLSNDGGWITRITGEFVYSPWGWDTYQVYTDPFTNAPAMLSAATLAALYTRGNFITSLSGVIPSPYPPTPASATQSGNQAGAGRFPQQICRPMKKLLGFLSQGLLAPLQELERVQNDTGGPPADISPLPDDGTRTV